MRRSEAGGNRGGEEGGIQCAARPEPTICTERGRKGGGRKKLRRGFRGRWKTGDRGQLRRRGTGRLRSGGGRGAEEVGHPVLSQA